MYRIEPLIGSMPSGVITALLAEALRFDFTPMFQKRSIANLSLGPRQRQQRTSRTLSRHPCCETHGHYSGIR